MITRNPIQEDIGVIVMNSEIKKRAKETVETITAKLDYSLIQSQFDEPIDEAARRFIHKTSYPVTHKTFHKVIAEFVTHIYDKGLNARWILSGEPLGHAINLLEKHYNSTYGRGYTAAILDTGEAYEGGIDVVLNQLAEIIKDIERAKHIKAVFTVNIDPTDWHLKCEIVSILLDEYKSFLPEYLLRCKPWELVSQIPTIIYKYICSESALQQVFSCREKPLTAEDLLK
jgi:hypothetical protein